MNRMTSVQEHQALRAKVDAMDDKLGQVLEAIRELREDANKAAIHRAENKAKLDRLTEDVAETKEIVAAWSAVKQWGTFIKWAAGIGAAVMALWAAWKGIDAGPTR